MRFNGWPELKETFLANDLEATFILAPLAMSLREQGVPIKIVYLGHRDGTTMMVRNDSTIFRIEALGKEAGILTGAAHFDDYADPSFVPDETIVQPYDWEGSP